MRTTVEDMRKAYEDKKRRTTQIYIPCGGNIQIIDEFGELLFKAKADGQIGLEMDLLDVMEMEYRFNNGTSTIVATVRTIPFEEDN